MATDQDLMCVQIVVVLFTMLYRNFDRMVVWLFTPHDDMLLVESEMKVTPLTCAACHPNRVS